MSLSATEQRLKQLCISNSCKFHYSGLRMEENKAHSIHSDVTVNENIRWVKSTDTHRKQIIKSDFFLQMHIYAIRFFPLEL